MGAENLDEQKSWSDKNVSFDLEGHKIEVEGHQGLVANQYRLIVDGEKVDEVDKAMGTHTLRGKLPAEGGAEPRKFTIALEGSLKNKMYLEMDGERQELSNNWVA